MDEMMMNEDEGTGDMMGMIMGKIDGFIKAGGASVEELEELKMDLGDMMEGDMEPEEPEVSEDSGMSGMIEKMRNKGAY